MNLKIKGLIFFAFWYALTFKFGMLFEIGFISTVSVLYGIFERESKVFQFPLIIFAICFLAIIIDPFIPLNNVPRTLTDSLFVNGILYINGILGYTAGYYFRFKKAKKK